MASEIDICNLALAHLGDVATVSSINPPEGSAQAQHCAMFYPIARDSLFEMHSWGFATKRIALASVTSEWPMWSYAYAIPADAVNLIAVLPPEAQDDYSTRFSPTDTPGYYANNAPIMAAGRYVPQPFVTEVNSAGQHCILTDQENAILRYTYQLNNPTEFSPLFVMALSWHLASMLAGPVIKGDAGAAEAKRCQQAMTAWLQQARASDANQRQVKPEHIVHWMSGR